jgi:hypothetical protein
MLCFFLEKFAKRKISEKNLRFFFFFLSFGMSKVDQWLDFAADLANAKKIEPFIPVLDAHLQLRTFVADYRITIADVGLFGALKGFFFSIFSFFFQF